MKITYLARTDGACDYYRVDQPLKTLGRNMKGTHFVHRMSQGELITAADKDDMRILKWLVEADVVVVPRLWDYKIFHLLKEIAPQAKMVLEYDDNLFEVSPFSIHYEDHGVDEVRVKLAGSNELINLWVDGVNIDLAENRKKQVGAVKAMSEADLVTVTTDRLKSVLEVFNPNVAVLPNCIDFKIWQRANLMSHKGVRLGWFGGASHYEDWCMVSNVLPELMINHPEVTLVLMGSKFDGTLKGIPQERIEFHEWVPTAAYPYKAVLLDLDLAIIPLRDSKFNRCKSPIKWLEMASLRIPSVCSMVPPYSDIATEDNGFWVEDNDAIAWQSALKVAIENAGLRQKVGNAAYETAKGGFDIDQKYKLWANAYEGLFKKVEVPA